MSQPLLAVRGLTLGYDRTDAVKGIDFDVHRGGVVTLIGANGAGKTTTMRGISGLLKARAGSIRFGDHELTKMAAHKIARLGIVQAPEGRQVFAEMTIAENLAMGAYLETDADAVAKRREAVLARFPRLGERLSQSAGLLSGGEQQMLAMGRALMTKPKLLLLDEPSMGLAPRLVAEIFATIRSLKDAATTILLVDQNARAALSIADRAYVLEVGRIALSGRGDELLVNPAVQQAYLGL